MAQIMTHEVKQIQVNEAMKTTRDEPAQKVHMLTKYKIGTHIYYILPHKGCEKRGQASTETIDYRKHVKSVSSIRPG